MSKFFNKIKRTYKDFTHNRRGFSLVELIVVIAIMVIMAVVLAPALLGYVETSRAQKDDSAMSEVVSATKLALADYEIYDELLEHAVYDNVSCYIDASSESARADNKIVLKDAYGNHKEQYMFDDDARLLDEVDYFLAGNMRGLTITFSPDKASKGDTYNLKDGIINKFVGRKTGYLYENPDLHNRIRSVIGDTLETTSQTYRNSDYTLFIKIGSTGGNEAVAQDAIQVWGQFSGTNLHENPNSFKLADGRVVGEDGKNDQAFNSTHNNTPDINFNEDSNLTSKHNQVIPVGGRYTVASTGEELVGDGKTVYFPETVTKGDIYLYEDYEYRYQYRYSRSNGGWIAEGTNWGAAVTDRTKSQYSDPLQEVNKKPITTFTASWADCINLVKAPKIPSTATSTVNAFVYCSNLEAAPELPDTLSNFSNTFGACEKLRTYVGAPSGLKSGDFSNYKLPNGTNFSGLFSGCKSLTVAPVIPNSATNISGMFNECTSLSIAPVIPANVQNVEGCFYGCTSLKSVTINSTPTNYARFCRYSTVTEILGSTTIKSELLATK